MGSMAAGGTARWAERFRHELMLLFCCGGIYVCYMLYGYYQEKMFVVIFCLLYMSVLSPALVV